MNNTQYVTSKYIRIENVRTKTLSFCDVMAIINIGYLLSGSTSRSYLYISMGLLAVWLLSAAMVNIEAFSAIIADKKVLMFAIYFLCIGVHGIWVGGAFFTAKQMGSAILLFSSILIFNFYKKSNRLPALKIVLLASLGLWLYFQMKSLVFYKSHEEAARILASEGTAFGNIAIGGGYALAYGSAILSIVLLDLLLSRHIIGKGKLLLSGFFLATSALVIIQTESTITVACWAVGMAACILLRPDAAAGPSGKITRRKLTSFIFFILIAIVILLSIKPFGRWLYEATFGGSGTLNVRLNSLGAALAGYAGEGSYAMGRAAIPLKSFRTFLQNPIFGVAYKHGNGFIWSGQFGIGNHCEWIDALSNYGVIGGIPFLLIYVIQVKEVLTSKVHLSPGWWICLLFMGIFNPYRTPQSQFALFFIIPAAILLLDQRNQNGISNARDLR